MAFEMSAGDRKEAISHGEESVFAFVARAPDKYPELRRLEQQFYTSPTITPQTAKALAAELRLLETGPGGGHQPLRSIVARLANFFEWAASEDQVVTCLSD